MKYDDKYYENIVKLNGYKYIDEDIVRNKDFINRWICSFNFEEFINGVEKKEKSMIIMGIGINGTPHLGTLFQLMNAIFLQKKGYKVQIILGDLDVYGARDIEIKEINKLIKKYKKFIINLGFDIKKGILRSQYESEKVLKTQYLISKYIDDLDFSEINEEINELYQMENVYKGMEFNVKQSIALMFADFIYPIMNEKYKHVLITSGIDEHGYVWKANEILKRMNLNGSISGIFTDILPGLNEYPKMSKSLKKSTIDLDINKRELKRIILNKDLDLLAIKLIERVSFYSLEKINIIRKHYYDKSKEWENDKLNYVDELYNICKMWKV